MPRFHTALRTLLVLALALSTAGCTSPNRPDRGRATPVATNAPPGDSSGRLTTHFTLETLASSQKASRRADPEAVSVDREAFPEGNVAAAYSSASQDFRRAAASRSWRHAHDRLRALLEERGLFPSTAREQMAALAFFREHLRALQENGVTPEEAEAIGFYAGRLLKNRNPESPLLLPALRALRGHWPDDRLARAAQTARRAARRGHDDTPATALPKRVAEANQALAALAGDLSGTGDRK
jgi:hypothetical protein